MFFSDRIVSIKPTDKVLEIGPGGTPFERSDVFLDLDPALFKDSKEAKFQRGNADELQTDKPVVYYDGVNFPFKDKEFDYVVCAHVLEHVDNVDLFCKELQRVANKGYIEFPTVYYDYLYNFDVHHNLILHDETSNTISYIKKEDTPLVFFKPVQDFYLQTLVQGYDDIIRDLSLFMFQGFEWHDTLPHLVRVKELNDITFDPRLIPKKQPLNAEPVENAGGQTAETTNTPLKSRLKRKVRSFFT